MKKHLNLAETIAKLQKSPLTVAEVSSIKNFQDEFDIQDDDPLIVVLAMMARSQLIIESMPNLLQQKSAETIELHRTVLREQAVLISKELITDVTRHIAISDSAWAVRWGRYAGCFVAGMVVASCLFFLARHFFKI